MTVPSHCCCCGLGCGCIFVGFIFMGMSISVLVAGTVGTVNYRQDSSLVYSFCRHVSGHILGNAIDRYYDGERVYDEICGKDKSFGVLVTANIMGVAAVWSGIEAIISIGFMWGASQESINWTTAWIASTSCWTTVILACTASFIFAFPRDNEFVLASIFGVLYSAIAIFCILIAVKFRKELLEGTSQQQNSRIQGVAAVYPTMHIVPAYPPNWQMNQGPITTQPHSMTSPYPQNHYSSNQQYGNQQYGNQQYGNQQYENQQNGIQENGN